MAEDLDSTILENASGPKQASADGVSTSQHSLADLIAADKYLAAKAAARASVLRAFTRVQIVPPGSV